MKIVFDAGVLISFSETCFLPLFTKLKDDIGEFIITKGVKNECIDRVQNIMRFKLSAIRINEYLDDFTFNVQDGNQELTEKTNRILQLTNSLFSIHNKDLKIVDFGEAESLALLGLTKATFLAIDERTTRMLVEDPMALLEIFKRKHRTKNINFDKAKYEKFKAEIGEVHCVRSVDLFAFCYRKGLLPELMQSKDYLKSALYALKFKGCSVSFEEIDKYIKEL